MNETTLKSLLQIKDIEYDKLLNLILDSDLYVGKHLLNENSFLFNISLYSFYPILFRGIFDVGSKEQDIMLFSRYYSGWLFILDNLYDEKNKYDNKMDLLIMSTSLSAAHYYLNKIITSTNSKAFDVVNSYRCDSDYSMKIESTYFRYGEKFEQNELDQYCIKKYALAKAVLYLCYISSENPVEVVYNCIMESHDYFAIAKQLIDEVEDFVEDYQNNKFNIYANELVLKYGKIIDEQLIKQQILNKAFNNIDKAIKSIESISDFGWKRFINFTKEVWIKQWKI